MTMICFVRHGETDWNLQGRFQGQVDIPLNARGRQQAAEAAKCLHGTKWDVVVTSPLSRAYETALILANALGVEAVEVCPELIECAFGEAEGLPYGEVSERFPDDDIPGREQLTDLHERAMRGLSKVVESHHGQCVLLVSHACTLNSILYKISGGAVGTSGIPNVRNGHVATLEYVDGKWSVSGAGTSAVAAN